MIKVFYFVRRAAVVALFLLFSLTAVSGVDLLAPGFRPLPPGVHALVGGTVVIKPGDVLDSATVVIRDGFIEAVGKDVVPPPDARVWIMKGLTIYAGFIDPYLTLGATNPPVSTTDSEPIGTSGLTSGVNFFGAPGQKTDRGNPGPSYEVSKITPERRAVQSYAPDAKTLESLRELGFTAGLIAPKKGILRGTSALVALADENPNEAVIKADVFQHIAFETHEDDEKAYPGSVMGVIAALRQSFFDAQHYALAQADFRKNPKGRKRPEFNPALEALSPAVEKRIPVAFEPGSALMVDRAARVARELGLDFLIVSSGQEWLRPDLAKAVGASLIVPLNFPTLPKLPSDDDWVQVKLDTLRTWDWAAENPALLRQQGLEIALTTYGLKEKKDFRKNLRLALDRGLSETDALAAMTTVPAKLCGVENQLGTIEAGKLANLMVVDGKSYFDPDAKVREVWIDGRIQRAPPEEPKKAKADEKEEAKSPEEGAPEKPKVKPEEKTPTSDVAKDEKKDDKGDKKKAELRELQKKRVARSPLEGRGVLAKQNTVFIRNATVWTCAQDGVLTNASLFIRAGKFRIVGQFKLEATDSMMGYERTGVVRTEDDLSTRNLFLPPTDSLIIDGSGLHITPGLIDCHSHTAIIGAVNESTLPSTAMCRIGDVVNSETDNLYEQLAGGLTVANLLHGSANPIGGQNQVIKLREGASPEELKFEGAMPGIKFALGENVKQSNWGEKFVTRFPQSRMGVRTFHANRFTAAQLYLKEWDAYRKNGGVPPRRDLELETIGEIIQGKRIIHCHSYRQDEILAFIRTMESFGVKIGTLQHILEGYKVADEIAKHGAGASAFADWWAYKFEVYDAIPYAGSLMRDRGVLVSFNSDSSELARHLYLEAAKAVKYGGTPQEEALKFVTINPAKQLRIDNRVGSLEPGKDADFVIWSKPPLDSETVCLQTWIEGKKYFDRSLAEERAAALKKEREALVAKAKKIAKLAGGGGSDSGEGSDDGSFFRVALEREFEGVERHCLDEEGGE